MRLGLSVIALVLSASAASPAMAEDRPGLAPSTPWTLDYDADSCALRRNFGTGEDRAFLEFRRFGPGMSLQAVIGSERMRVRQPVRFSYRFGEVGEWTDSGINISAKLGNGSEAVIFAPSFMHLPELDEIEDPQEREAYLKSIDWRAAEREQAAAADTITLRGAFTRELKLKLGSLAAPMDALNQCIDELMTHWNIDVEAHKSLSRPAMPINLPEGARMMDYPPKMVRQSLPGLVNVRLAISETGRVTACHIQMPLSDPEFEESSCADIQHALEFDPALDKDGNPIASYWITKVLFKLT